LLLPLAKELAQGTRNAIHEGALFVLREEFRDVYEENTLYEHYRDVSAVRELSSIEPSSSFARAASGG